MLKLFSTEGCHLCEMAFALTQEMVIDMTVEIVDIAMDEKLFHRYGVTIPVLYFQGAELNWPFDSQALQHWLDSNGITYHP